MHVNNSQTRWSGTWITCILAWLWTPGHMWTWWTLSTPDAACFRCRLRLENTMATCCRWDSGTGPTTVSEFGARVWKLLWARIANFADGKGEDCSGFGSCQHFPRKDVSWISEGV
jgi:hypothetical protein